MTFFEEKKVGSFVPLFMLVLYLILSHFVSEWVQSVWEADFVDLTNFPVESEESLVQKDYLARELTSLGSVVKRWLLKGNQDDDGQGERGCTLFF